MQQYLNSITSTLAQWTQLERNLPGCTKWACKLKVRFYWRYCSRFILISSAFICLPFSFSFQHEKKSYEDISRSAPHVSAITGNILITILRFAHFFLTFMTDSQYLVTNQIWRNLNEHCYYLTSSKSMICKK